MESDDDSLLSIDGKEVVSDKGVGHSLTCIALRPCLQWQQADLAAASLCLTHPMQFLTASCTIHTASCHERRHLPSVTQWLWALVTTPIMRACLWCEHNTGVTVSRIGHEHA